MTEVVPRADWRGACARLAIPFLVGIVPVFAILTSKGVVIPVAVGALCALVAGLRRPGRGDLPLGMMGLLVAWAGLSILWSFAPSQSTAAIRLALDFAMGAALYLEARAIDPRRRERVLGTAAWGAAATVVALAVIHAFGPWIPNGLFAGKEWLIKIKPASTILAAFAWPVAVYLWRARSGKVAALFTVAVLAVLASGEASSAQLAAGVGALVFIVSLAWHRLAARTLAAVLAVGVLLAPVLAALPVKYLDALEGVKTTGIHRVGIWDFVARHVEERPLLGWGFNTSRAIPGGKEQVLGMGEALPLHPHNLALQVWLELGLAGAVLAAAALAGMALAVAGWERRSAAGALAGYSAALVIAMMSYGAWQDWWLASLIALLVVIRALPGEAPAP